uniref:UDP-glucuronosyltransferase 1-6-like n=1 Tax=Dermatophagoides pteronyssinus TaxID=6956 RepID=A0A6P6YMG5_DERPT|nr:UDP-glucuronosyltransferase 1-6-like [Dermatophagoides pteronyssinus]
MSSKSLKILFQPADGIGHINAAIGLAQALANRGHQVFVFTLPNEIGTFKKFGLNEIHLQLTNEENNKKKNDSNDKKDADKDHPLKSSKETLERMSDAGIFSHRSSIDKIDAYRAMIDVRDQTSHGYQRHQQLKEIHPQMVTAIDKLKPNLIIADSCHFSLSPCIAYGKIPWIFLYSENPLSLFDSPNVPPPLSGYPTYDKTCWKEFREKFQKDYCESHCYAQNLINKELGYPEVDEKIPLLLSPYLNIYGFPEELDYTDLAKLPDNYIRMDTYCRKTAEKFELPDEFKKKIQTEDKLIYLSLGSMAGFDVELMKRLVKILGKTSHKYIVSKGILHDQYELPDNMWGGPYVPQTEILPIVDMVITHGGNNTVSETLSFGKPMLVMPSFVDQFDNAQRITEKGYGYRLDTYGFTDEELIETVDRILNDQQMKEKCKKAGERIQNSNSKEKACEKIEELAEKFSKTN